MPLLEKRPRAVFDAAPVKQNIPPEVLEQLRTQRSSRGHVLSVLHYYADRQYEEKAPEINDVVTVRRVDLRQYDALSIGKEAAANV